MTLDLNPSFAFYFDLPWPISYLPKICRILALIYIAPPVFLFLFDIGGYLLFKIFLKPFGHYPMHNYFKQAPPPSSLDQAHEDLNSASSSPIASPAIVIDSLPTTPDGMRHRHPHLPHESTDPTSHHQALRPKPNPSSSMSVEGVGFEGPMLDFKSPTASDYGDESHSNEELDPGDSSETTSN